MARILYGIHGTGHGHAMRALTIARKLGQHDFLFVASDDAPAVLEPEFPVCRIPNLGTVFKNYQVDLQATIKQAIPILLHRKEHIKTVLEIFDRFKPDVCMTDLEYFVPSAAEQAGLPCLTLDHQHILTCCRHHLPPKLWWDLFFQGLTPRFLFKPTDYNLLVSFYAPPILPQYRARVVPPILRERVLQATVSDAGHILVYQSNSLHANLVTFLRQATKRTCYFFGHNQTEGRLDNIIFQPKSEEGFLSLLESCSYVIQGGSHTLMSEALYLGKPVLSLPLQAMLEQQVNAFYLEQLGYGLQADMQKLTPELLQTFEACLPRFHANIQQSQFCGNALVFKLVDDFAQNGRLEMRGGL